MTLLALALALAAAPAAPAGSGARPAALQDESIVRWYDVRALLAQEYGSWPLVDLRTHLESCLLQALEPDGYDVELEDPPSLEDEGLADVVGQLVEDLDGVGEVDLDQRGGRLRVAGSEAAHAAVRRVLADLEALALDGVEVEVHRLALTEWAGLAGALLDAETAAAVLDEASLVARRRVPVGRSARVATAGVVNVLYDYDVEVAQGALAIDPQVTVVRAGLDLAVNAHLTPDGRLALRAWGRNGALAGAPREHALEAFAGAALQLPRVATAVVAGSAVLASGEACALGAPTDRGGLVVRVRRDGGPAAPGAEPASLPGGARSPFVPLGEVVLRAARPRLPHVSGAEPSGGLPTPDFDLPDWLSDGDALLEPEEVFDGLRDLCDERGIEGRMLRLGDVVYAPDDGPLRAAAREHVSALQAALGAETFALELRTGEVAPEDLGPLAAPGAGADEALEALARLLPSRALACARTGEGALLVQGVEELQLVDFDVEIAQASTVLDPIVRPRFDGFVARCVPVRAPGGAVVVALDLAAYGSQGFAAHGVADWDPEPMKVLDENPQPIGKFVLRSAVELSATRRAEVHAGFAVREGAWTLVALEDVNGPPPLGRPATGRRAFVALLRVTARR